MHIRIITDGKIGDLVQCRGVAHHLGGNPTIECVVTGGRRFRLPFTRSSEAQSCAMPDPKHGWPDLVIASGRRTLPALKDVRRANRSIPLVYLKDPRWPGRRAADVIWAPRHDGLKESDTVIVTDTSPHGLTPDILATHRHRARQRFAELGEALTGIILGGDSGAVRWTQAESDRFAALLAENFGSGETCVITASRRTPPVLFEAVCSALPKALIDDGKENAYPQLIAATSRLVVTGDSHNMVSEALAGGAPVYVFRPKGLQKKLNAFIDRMVERGAVRDLRSESELFDGVAVDASAEIASGIRRRLAL